MDSNKLKQLIKEEVHKNVGLTLLESPGWSKLPAPVQNLISRTVRSVKRFFNNQGVQGFDSSFYDQSKGHYVLTTTLNNDDWVIAYIKPTPDLNALITIEIKSKNPSRNVRVSEKDIPALYGKLKTKYNNALLEEAKVQMLK